MAEDGHILECRVRGNLRLENSRSTNPVAVGDWVELEPVTETSAVISAVSERKNHIVRKSVNLSREFHVLAANLDYLVVLATPSNPRTPHGFIDRMLVTARAYGIEALLVFNKQDMWTVQDRKTVDDMESVYSSAGYDVYRISALKVDDISPIALKIRGSVSIIAGQSGSGKSTFLKTLRPDLEIRVADLSVAHKQGKHTTTFAEMHKINQDTFIIDTPGVREFGLAAMNRQELGHYFPEFYNLSTQCRFANCMHLAEPDCAVLKALDTMEISPFRYRSYLGMLEECN